MHIKDLATLLPQEKWGRDGAGGKPSLRGKEGEAGVRWVGEPQLKTTCLCQRCLINSGIDMFWKTCKAILSN